MLANHVDLEFFDAVSSYVTAMIHSFIKTKSMGMVLKKKKYAKGFVDKLKKLLMSNVLSTTSSIVMMFG